MLAKAVVSGKYTILKRRGKEGDRILSIVFVPVAGIVWNYGLIKNVFLKCRDEDQNRLRFEMATEEYFQVHNEDIREVKSTLERRLGFPILPTNL